MELILELPRDIKILKLLLDDDNQLILNYIQTYEDHGLRAIGEALGYSYGKIWRCIKQMKKTGILKTKTKGRGRKPNTYRISKGQEILKALVG